LAETRPRDAELKSKTSVMGKNALSHARASFLLYS